MATFVAAFRDGLARVRRAPVLLLGVFLLTLLVTVAPGLVLQQSIAESFGNSRDAEAAVSGVSTEWWDRFGETATGLDRTLSPTIIGFGAVLDNVSRVLDNGPQPLVVTGLVAAYLLVWLFLIGGILDRYARNRATRTAAFFSACGVYFARFIRLGILAGFGYALLFGVLHGWLFDDFYRWAIRDLTVERSAFLLRVALYLLFGVIVVFWNVVLDYAKIRAVVEDRHSMLGALLAGWRFVVRHPGKVGGLYLANGACAVLVVGLYALVAPGGAGGGRVAWMGFLVGQIYVFARLAVKMLFYASQTALFQLSLAHAAYAASPVPLWPESPAAEAIVNAAERQAPWPSPPPPPASTAS